MKRLILIIVCLCFTMLMQAQVYKTATVTAGGLSTSLTATELSTVTNLTLLGTIDARDFKTMRDNMPVLAVLDISGTSVEAYSGWDGTSNNIDNLANAIPDFAFCNTSWIGKTSLTSVLPPSTITSIGSYAFGRCNGLTSFTIPSSVTSISSAVFWSCTGLTSISIPNSVISLGSRAFDACIGLTSITIPSSITSIEGAPFQNCTGLISVNIPTSVTSIGDNSFFNCTSLTSVTIPSSVTSIGTSAFYNCTYLTSVDFPATSSLTSIGNWAFYQCQVLTSVTIPSSVTSIGSNAFNFCSGLTSVNFSAPSSLTSIGNAAFYQCQGLTSVTIPSSVTTIGASTFYACSKLTSVNFSAPSSLTTLGDYAFYYCTGLTTVNLSATSLLTSIGYEAFSGCASLTSINIPSSVTLIESYSFYNCTGLTSVNFSATSSLTSIEYGTFYGCAKLTSVNIPSSVTSIGGYSFYGCTKLTSVTIPPSVMSIKPYAFYNCTGLTSIYAQLETPVNLSSSLGVFGGVNTSTCILHVPYGSSALYAAADQWKDFTNKVEMAEFKVSATKARIESVGGSSASIGLTTALSWTTLSNQSWLTVSPASGSNIATLVLTAGENTSYSPRYAKVAVSAADVPTQTIFITQLGVLQTVNNTAGGLFAALTAAQRSQITRLTVTGTIDARDFKTMRDDMPMLAEIDISNATIAAYTGTGGTTSSATYPVNTVPQYAFYNQSTGVSKKSLTSIILPSTATSIDRQAFYNCSGLSDFTIPSSVKSIGYQAFYQCTGLTSFTIPSSVTSLDTYTFYGCTGLTSFNFSANSSLTSMGTGTFLGCTGLTSVTIPSSLTSIPIHTFYQCTGLTSVNIPSSVTSIEEAAFYQCYGLTSVNLPSSVTSIGQSAFSSCTGLTSVNFPSSVKSLGANAFAYCYGLTSVTFSAPSSLTSIGSAAFYNCKKLVSVILPESVISIGSSAFSNCEILSTVSIPSMVTLIGEYCFYNSSVLTSIYAYPATPVNLTPYVGVFLNVNKTTCKLFVPYNSKVLYAAANQWKDFLKILEIPTAGSIAANQTICYNTSPATITSTSPGLVMTGATLSYRWEYSTDGIVWTLTGAANSTLTPGNLTQTTNFHRITISTLDGFSWESLPTVAVTITVMTEVTAGTIGTAQTICNGTSPSPLTSTAAGNGSGIISYEWQTNTSGSYVTIAGATSAGYSPPSLTATRSYQRRTVSLHNGVNCYSGYTAPVTITVQSVVTAGIRGIPQTICNGTIPSPITSIALGTGSGTISYEWQTNSGGSYVTIAVATSADYSPPLLTANTSYQRRTVSLQDGVNCYSGYTSPVTITVQSVVTAGTIGTNQTVCNGTTPSPLTSTAVGTGSGTISYEWQTNASGSYVTIAGATSAGYSPPSLTVTTSYQRRTVSLQNGVNCYSGYTSPVTITVQSVVSAGTIGTNQTICNGTTPLPLTSIALGTGSGTISYEWQTNSGGSYVTIAGATSAGYSPPTLIATTSYQRRTVSLQNSINCYSGYTTPVTVTVNALPAQPTITAGGSTTFCEGGNVQLTSSAGSSFLWSTGAITQSITVNAAGSYWVKVKNAAGCESIQSLSTVVTVNALPATPSISAGGALTFCAGGSVTLSASTGTGYKWSTGATTSSINVTRPGSYSVQVTNPNGCLSVVSLPKEVMVNDLPLVDAGNNSIIPYGTSEALNATVTGTGPFTYSWSPSGKLVNALIEDPTTVNLTETTVFTLIATSTTTTCSNTDVVTITISGGTVSSTPTATPATVCTGANVQLNAVASGGSGSYTYTWTSVPAGFTSSLANPIANPLVNTTYHVAVSDGFTTVNSQVMVTVNALPLIPTIAAGGSTTFCEGGSVTLTSSAGAGYLWSTGAITQSLTVNAAGSYWVKVKNAAGCESIQSLSTVVIVNALPAQPTITAGGSTTFCEGGSVILTSGASTGYLWSTGAITSSIDVTTSGSYSVQVTNVNGCKSAVSLPAVVTVNDLPVVDAGINTTISYGTSTAINATVTGTDPFTYSWSPSGKLVNASIEDPATVNLTETTIFTLTATSIATSCSNKDVVTITVGGGSLTLSSTPTATPKTICAGADVQLDAVASGGLGTYTYTWSSVPEGFTSSLANPIANPLVNTTYHVTVFDGFTTVNSQVAVTVNTSPAIPTISAGGSLTFCDGGSVTLTSSAGAGYLWSTGATTSSIIVTTLGSYSVQVTNANGCLSTASLPTIVTVNTVSSASVSIAAFPSGAISAGTSVTFTANPINGGSAPTYLWKKGGVAIPLATSSTYTSSSLVDGNVITVEMTSSAACAQGSPAVSNPITMVVSQGVVASVSISVSENNVCAGTPVTFTATPTNGGTSPTYVWYLNNVAVHTGVSGTYVPKNGDVVYVVMTSSNPDQLGSPAKSNVITMTVNPKSIGGSVSGGSNICSGSNSGLLSLSGHTGTVVKWQSSVSPFSTWTDIANTATTYTSGALIQTTQFRAVIQSGNCTMANSAGTTLTVNAMPATPVVTVVNNCGSSILSIPKGGIILWNNGASTNSITVTTAGTYTVTRNVNGCTSAAGSALATPGKGSAAQPGNFTISTSNVCSGSSNVVYTVPFVAGVTYNWCYLGFGATITGTGNSVMISFSDYATSGILSVRASNGCKTSLPRMLIVNVTNPPAQPAYFTEGKAFVSQGESNVRYTVPYKTGLSYMWSFTGTGATITGTSNSVLISFSGSATSGTLSVKVSNSCGTSDPRSGVITVGNTLKAGIISDALEQVAVDLSPAKNELKAYPNPSSGPVTFDFQINEDAKVTLDLLSMTGQRIARIFDADVQAGITQTVIYGESLPSGVYVYVLKWNDQVLTGKLIRNK